MVFDNYFLYIFISILLTLNIIIIVGIFIVKHISKHNYKMQNYYQRLAQASFSAGKLPSLNLKKSQRIPYLLTICKSAISINIPNIVSIKIMQLLKAWKIHDFIKRMLKSPLKDHKAMALKLLMLFDSEVKASILKKQLHKEKSVLLRLQIIHMLCETDLYGSIYEIASQMRNGTEQYKQKVIKLLTPYASQLVSWTKKHKDTENTEYKRVIIIAAKTKQLEWYFSFLMKEIYSQNINIRKEAAEILFKKYGNEIETESLLQSPYIEIRQQTVKLIIKRMNPLIGKTITQLLNNKDLRTQTIQSLKSKISKNPILLPIIFDFYKSTQSEIERLSYASVLSIKIEYFIFQLKSDQQNYIIQLLKDSVSIKQSSNIVNFLNHNKDHETEQLLFKALKPHIVSNKYFLQQCQLYLKKSIQKKWDIAVPETQNSEPKMQLTFKDKVYMVIIMIITLLLPFIFFYIQFKADISYKDFKFLFVDFLLNYQYIFAFYTISINLIYLILMILSCITIHKQHIAWETTDKQFLFTPKLLPSVTILAPAYNEEKTIIQNIYSLLSLDYPDLEVIVINDGSSDNTAKYIINHFELKLADFETTGEINTAPVIGIYKNKELPNLILVNKQNGGKADSLNAGINISSSEYICSIDADCLMESDALLKIMHKTLTNSKETAAIGGNIIPNNGNKVQNGSIQEIHIPQNSYARYQTVEYLRSFVTGRLGWTKLKSLLIISGAFGVFNKKRVLEIGGYMTGKGKLKKDTVGEDMEIVVRLIKHLSLQKIPFIVDYAHNANCWTEVPEDLTSLVMQRDRWQRGLIEVLVYHRDILFNKKFGTAGLIAFPYFYIFELLGPFLEAIGYIVLVISLFFGLLSNQVFLFMFSIVILFGITISSISVFLAEKDILYFKGNDFGKFLFTAIAENFGYRQFLSFIRPISYISYLFKNKGWQKLKRKGFQTTENKTNGDIEL